MSPENGRQGWGWLPGVPWVGWVLVNALRLCYWPLAPLFTLHSLVTGKSSKKQLLQQKKLRNSLPLKVVTGFLIVISHYKSYLHLLREVDGL